MSWRCLWVDRSSGHVFYSTPHTHASSFRYKMQSHSVLNDRMVDTLIKLKYWHKITAFQHTLDGEKKIARSFCGASLTNLIAAEHERRKPAQCWGFILLVQSKYLRFVLHPNWNEHNSLLSTAVSQCTMHTLQTHTHTHTAMVTNNNVISIQKAHNNNK